MGGVAVTRPLSENGRSQSRGGDVVVGSEEEASTSPPASALTGNAGRARVPRQREDPSGRRSLTGLEFRRQRSI